MVRLPILRTIPSPIPRLQSIIEGGLTTPLAIGLVTGISEEEIALLLVARIKPTEDQREKLEELLKSYELVIRLANAETMKGRL